MSHCHPLLWMPQSCTEVYNPCSFYKLQSWLSYDHTWWIVWLKVFITSHFGVMLSGSLIHCPLPFEFSPGISLNRLYSPFLSVCIAWGVTPFLLFLFLSSSCSLCWSFFKCVTVHKKLQRHGHGTEVVTIKRRTNWSSSSPTATDDVAGNNRRPDNVVCVRL